MFDRYGNRRFDTNNNNTTTLAQSCATAICNPEINATNNRLIGTSFDSAGNTTVDAAGQTFVYDAENKQVQVSNASGIVGRYFYDGDGKRVKKVVPATGETTIFVSDASGKLVAEYSTIVEPITTAKISYLTNDHLGSPRILTDANGTVISRRDFLPFGEEIPSGTGGRNSAQGYFGVDSIRQKFTSYERDIETDTDFAEERYYNYKLGRFNSVDPENYGAEIVDPQSWNAYAYSLNNPLSYIDPDGLKPVWLQMRDSNGNLTQVMRADDEAEGYQGLLDGGWKAVQYNDNGEFQYTADFGGQTRYVILTSNGEWRWGDYYQQLEPETIVAPGFVTNVPTTAPPTTTAPPETLPKPPNAPTQPPVTAPTSTGTWFLRLLRILSVPGIILGSPLECCQGAARRDYPPDPTQPELSKKKGPDNNEESTGKGHRKIKRSKRDKHTAPRPGRRNTKDRKNGMKYGDQERNKFKDKIMRKKKLSASKIGQDLFYGDGVRKSYKKAFPYLLEAAEKGNIHCQNLVGYCYDLGLGVEKNSSLAFQWYKKASAANHIEATANLALLYEKGKGVEKNPKQAFLLYKKAAEMGDVWSQCNLAIAYFNGIGTEKDKKEGINWLRKSAQSGDSKSQYNLGLEYLEGTILRKNKKNALSWLRKAANQGHKKAEEKIKSIT